MFTMFSFMKPYYLTQCILSKDRTVFNTTSHQPMTLLLET